MRDNKKPAAEHTSERRPVAVIAYELTGRRPAPATVWRLVHRGVRGGVKLRAQLWFGRWVCSKEEFLDFLEEQTAAALGGQSSPAEHDTDSRLRAMRLLGDPSASETPSPASS